MEYISTRGGGFVSAAEAIVRGIAGDGGLFVPGEFPPVSSDEIARMAAMSYPERALLVIGRFLREFDVARLEEMILKACARFDTPRVAPLRKLADGQWALELWHGPTLAFKDVALTLLPHLMTASAKMVGEKRLLLVLAATSGDTGKAALSGFQDVEGTACAVYYPLGGVSEAQRLQMVTQRGENAHVMAVRGNFDDAQSGVKAIFADPAANRVLNERGAVLTSANSINWGRLLPQIVYYFSAYADLMAAGEIRMGQQVNFCVPTGNFGNILAAYYARRMGLPVGRLICASNENNVLSDFLSDGIYDRRRAFHLTTSPSMDILISSNLERMLFEVSGRDPGQVALWMRLLREEGVYRVDGGALEALQSLLWGGWASREDCAAEILETWRESGWLADPHTAVALRVLRDYRRQTGDDRPCVTASTASPFKFARAVCGALGLDDGDEDDFALCGRLADRVGMSVPSAIGELQKLPVRHRRQCEPEEMFASLLEEMGFRS